MFSPHFLERIEDVFFGSDVHCLQNLLGVSCFRVLKEGTGRYSIGLLSEMDEGELRSAVDTKLQTQLAFCRLHLCDIDMEAADRIAFKLFLRRLVALDIR